MNVAETQDTTLTRWDGRHIFWISNRITMYVILIATCNAHRMTASASLMNFLRVSSSFLSSDGGEMISMSVRLPRRSRTCRPVVPASPSIKTFLVANNSIMRAALLGDAAAEGANAETPGATAAAAANRAREDAESFIAC